MDRVGVLGYQLLVAGNTRGQTSIRHDQWDDATTSVDSNDTRLRCYDTVGSAALTTLGKRSYIHSVHTDGRHDKHQLCQRAVRRHGNHLLISVTSIERLCRYTTLHQATLSTWIAAKTSLDSQRHERIYATTSTPVDIDQGHDERRLCHGDAQPNKRTLCPHGQTLSCDQQRLCRHG